MADELAVWLYGERVATGDRKRGRPRLVYTGEALGRYDLGTPLLSLALPVTTERYAQGVARPFLDGLLPEGEPRKSIAKDLGLRADDTYGLIEALGRDCAGAVVIQPLEDARRWPRVAAGEAGAGNHLERRARQWRRAREELLDAPSRVGRADADSALRSDVHDVLRR